MIIPYENQQAILKQIDGITIIAVKTFQEVLDEILVNPPTEQKPFNIEINKESV